MINKLLILNLIVVLISADEKEEIREIEEANFIETCLIVNSTKYLKC